MLYIYNPEIENLIVKSYKSNTFFKEGQFFYLKRVSKKYNFSILSFDLMKKKLNHSSRMKIFKNVIDKLTNNEIYEIAITLAFYDSTDHLIDFINLIPNFDPTYKTSINLSFKFFQNSIYTLKNINIFEAALYGEKRTTINYIINKYNFKFWDEFLSVIYNKYGTLFTTGFNSVKKCLTERSYKLSNPEILSSVIITQFFKHNMDKHIMNFSKENPNTILYQNLFTSLVENGKYYLLKDFYNNNFHDLIEPITFKKMIIDVHSDLFDFSVKFNKKSRAKNICGIFRILMKYYEEYLTINEINTLFNDRVFLTSLAGFQSGVEIFKIINKYNIDYNYRDESGYRLIDDAARYGSLATYKFLSKKTTSEDFYYLIDHCDSIYNICFYNDNLDLIKYIFNKYTITTHILNDINIDRCLQIITNKPYDKLNGKLTIDKIRIISKLLDIRHLLPCIFCRWINIDTKCVNSIINMCEEDISNKLCLTLVNGWFCSKTDVTIPKILYLEENFNSYKRLLRVYAKYDRQCLISCFKSSIKHKCIHTKWIKEFDKYFVNKADYLCHYQLFNKEKEYGFDECPHNDLFNCSINTFNTLKKELDEETYYNLKSNMDVQYYAPGNVLDYYKTYWIPKQLDRWDNPDFVRFYFLTVIKLNNNFMRCISYEEFKKIRGWILLGKYLRRMVRRKNIKKFNYHKTKFTPFINMIEYEPNLETTGIHKNIGRKFKVSLRKNMGKKVNNPIHLKPEHLLDINFTQFDYYISEKADGIPKLIDVSSTKLFPKFPKKYSGFIKTEYIPELNMHFIFGIDDDEVDDFEFINDLRKDDTAERPIETFSDIMEFYDNDLQQITSLKSNMENHTFSKNTVFWIPKRIFKVFGINMLNLLHDVSNNQTHLFPTDGWIFWKNIKYLDKLEDITYFKMKPEEHLTVDLKYNCEGEMTDFEKNKYRVFVGDQSLKIGEIYRCYFDREKEIWYPREEEIRKDKNNPNNKEIVRFITESHTKYKWSILDIIKIRDVDYYTKRSFEKTKLSKDYKTILNKISDGSVLDVGCGYSPLKREFNKYLGKNKYVGLDSDFNVFRLYSGINDVLWYDLNKDGMERWGNLYNYFVDNKKLKKILNTKYDNILIVNSIHYFDQDKLFRMIKNVSKSGTRVYVKYLSKEVFNEKIKDFDGYIDNDDNWVVKEGEDKLKIYYHWTHTKPHIEKLISSKSLHENFRNIGFKKCDVSFFESMDYGNVWNEYMKCFVLEEYVCL